MVWRSQALSWDWAAECSRHDSIPRGLLCGAGALALSLFTEWKFHHFLVDNSFSYMLNHISEKGPVTLLMMMLGTVIAFWVGKDGGFRWPADRRSRQTIPGSTTGPCREGLNVAPTCRFLSAGVVLEFLEGCEDRHSGPRS